MINTIKYYYYICFKKKERYWNSHTLLLSSKAFRAALLNRSFSYVLFLSTIRYLISLLVPSQQLKATSNPNVLTALSFGKNSTGLLIFFINSVSAAKKKKSPVMNATIGKAKQSSFSIGLSEASYIYLIPVIVLY